MDIETMLTPKDVAALLKVSVRTAQRLMKQMPHCNVGLGDKREIIRVKKEDLEDYLESISNEGSKPAKTTNYAPSIRNSSRKKAEIKKMPRRY